jgi:hypothetical protein
MPLIKCGEAVLTPFDGAPAVDETAKLAHKRRLYGRNEKTVSKPNVECDGVFALARRLQRA